MSAAVELRGVTRTFGKVRAVDDISFRVEEGEFFSMLGPSGSGKTTCLRLIAGFELCDSGAILLHGDDVSRTPPYRRPVNTVFQDYALFPHMSVLDNVAYGLRVRRVPRREREDRARQMLATVQLPDMAKRRPAELSGGQRQRVALARALINQPRVLLLDEPLGALDLKLREEMQLELKSLQRKLGITFVYVTHDQHEALGMSDRVAVVNRGRIEQLDTPDGLYERPRTAFIATFVGTSNVCTGPLAAALGHSSKTVSVRPERVRFGDGGDRDVTLSGTVLARQYHGATSRYDLAVADAKLCLVCPSTEAQAEPGQAVTVHVPAAAIHELEPADSGLDPGPGPDPDPRNGPRDAGPDGPAEAHA
ncbi:ABC transporter ATP-binding protein [Paraliomyxa miuraensis]|uniref:ABC transporter ATP-binding protein n=1 Tax=Paraliomyxa miuraensis TaxID=376150 RepID=UPI0022566E70|nr:ABC transporter ATP-binding protein [Paraliomyxa miuraensis]MCX4243393.1 ABC transporter ATP-binding protein [Paraliomyxa miuraensis]